jgi:hypothetical protein
VRVIAAIAVADLGKLDAAEVEVAKSRELWVPTRADRYGDVDRPAALLALRRGRLDAAESLAAASVRRWEGISQISRTHSGVVLATIHVRAGEPGGLALAHSAVTTVTKISSVRVRKRLVMLADELAARPGTDAKDLSRMAHQVAGVRPDPPAPAPCQPPRRRGREPARSRIFDRQSDSTPTWPTDRNRHLHRRLGLGVQIG